MRMPAAVWRIIVVLSVVNAGAALGDEGSGEGAHYFWDLASYVTALDSRNPYQSDAVFPFLYPPAAADLFALARSHLFELMSIAHVAAVALFLHAFTRLGLPRRFEWLCAMTAMGGLGVVSLLTGNVAISMNFSLLALLLHAANGSPTALRLLPFAIGFGGVIKPQFVLYVGVLPCIETSRRTAAVKAAAAVLLATAVHALYMWLRPEEWAAYVSAVLARTTEVKDFGWGPAAVAMLFSQSNAAAVVAYGIGLGVAAALAYAAWRSSLASGGSLPRVVLACLTLVVLTFANPRVPLYDLYAAGIAVAVCGAASSCSTKLPWALALALAINVVPWTIDNFARSPLAYPWWLRHLLLTHLTGLAVILAALAWKGRRVPHVRPSIDQ